MFLTLNNVNIANTQSTGQLSYSFAASNNAFFIAHTENDRYAQDSIPISDTPDSNPITNTESAEQGVASLRLDPLPSTFVIYLSHHA